MYNKKVGTIMQFDKEYFESFLDERCTTTQTNITLWEYWKFDKGEHCYLVKFGDPFNDVRILVRSSIGKDGLSATTGEDSIRCYLVECFPAVTGIAVGVISVKTQRWVTRLPGWEDRVIAQFSVLRGYRSKAGNCPKCSRVLRIKKVKKEGKNKGRIFASCLINHPDRRPGDGTWKWITDPDPKKKDQ